jgi:hypothetical protein
MSDSGNSRLSNKNTNHEDFSWDTLEKIKTQINFLKTSKFVIKINCPDFFLFPHVKIPFYQKVEITK